MPQLGLLAAHPFVRPGHGEALVAGVGRLEGGQLHRAVLQRGDRPAGQAPCTRKQDAVQCTSRKKFFQLCSNSIFLSDLCFLDGCHHQLCDLESHNRPNQQSTQLSGLTTPIGDSNTSSDGKEVKAKRMFCSPLERVSVSPTHPDWAACTGWWRTRLQWSSHSLSRTQRCSARSSNYDLRSPPSLFSAGNLGRL